MPQPVYYYDDDWNQRESERVYEEVGTVETLVERGDWHRTMHRQATDLWLDPETGLVVGNIGAYERWLNNA